MLKCLHPFLGTAGSVDTSYKPTSYKPGAEQMERGEITQSHLLFCSMIHVATDDSYSLSISISLSFSLSLHINTHTLIHDKAMPADPGQLWAADVPHCLRLQPCIHIRVKPWVIARC